MKSTFSTLFYVRRNQINKEGKAAIMVRITINGEQVQFSSKQQVELSNWDTPAGKVRGRTSEAAISNRLLDAMRSNINELYYKQIEEYGYASPEKIKNKILGIDREFKTLLEFTKAHNELYGQKVGYNTSHITHRRYELVGERIQDFLKAKYKVSDIPIRDVNPIFLERLYLYLRKVCKVQNNYAMKFMQRFQRNINFARNSGAQIPDPYECFNVRFEEVERDVLTQQEVDAIYRKEFITARLDQVRDLFIFSCYTGICFIDLMQLEESNLQIGVDGNLWVMIHRQKTKVKSNIRLLDIPLKILKKYEGERKNGKLFPVPTNQKVNEYLKEIGNLCGIEKRLNFHIRRHRIFSFPLKTSKLQSDFCRQVTI